MPAAFSSFVRCLLVLSLWLGLGVAASSAEAAPTSALDLRSDIHLRLIEVLGGPELCGDEDDPDAEVLCGGDLLADLVVDPTVFKLSRASCSRLLEALYRRAVCDPSDVNCARLHHGGLPPGPPLDLLGSGSGAAAVHAALAAARGPHRAELSALRARDDPPLLSQTTCPEAPPPRVRLA